MSFYDYVNKVLADGVEGDFCNYCRVRNYSDIHCEWLESSANGYLLAQYLGGVTVEEAQEKLFTEFLSEQEKFLTEVSKNEKS